MSLCEKESIFMYSKYKHMQLEYSSTRERLNNSMNKLM